MAFPTSNIHLKGTISDSGIYAEFFGVNNNASGGLRDITNDNNISLGDLLRKQIILDNNNNRETFALTDSLTQNVTDTASADNLLMNSSTNVKMSEVGGYARQTQIFSFSGISNMSGVGSGIASIDVRSDRSGGCVVPVLMTVEIYCKRVGNDLVWFAGEGEHSTGDHSIEGSGISITSDTEICRLAGAAANTNVVVSCGQTAFATNTTGGMLGQTAVTSSGSSSSAMTSTNTKVGFRYKTSGQVECATSGTAVRQHFLHQTFINHPDHNDNIQFTMTAGLRGIYTTGIPGCC